MASHPAETVSVEDDPIRVAAAYEPARQAILRGLRSHNEAMLGPIDYQPFALVLRLRGLLAGGFVGSVHFGWLFVEVLWVEPASRRAGHGGALMARGETEGRRRGASHSYLNTFSFQAPDFYKRLGYREYARIDDFPPGHQRIFMTKAL